MGGLSEVYLNGTAAFLPNRAVKNDEIETVLGIVGGAPSRLRARILRANGIHSRHYAIDPLTRVSTHSCAQLSAAAVEKLFQAGVDKNAVSLLAAATSYPDQIMRDTV